MFELLPLPYALHELEPVMSRETLEVHHGAHHAKYVETTNELLSDEGDRPASLEDVVRRAARSGQRKLYNNAAQAWNHGFFWNCMTPDHSAPSGGLAAAIERDFGDLDELRQQLVGEGAAHFASGWAWLVFGGGGLKVVSTHDAESFDRLQFGVPLLVCDLWEHAYYLDHQNDRKAFLEAWFDRLVDWRFAERQFQAASGGPGWRYPARGS